MKVHLILMLAFTATACAWQPSLVVMVGPAEGVSSLAGGWPGEYGSSATERSGTVWFKLATRRTATPQVLTTRFVRVEVVGFALPSIHIARQTADVSCRRCPR